MATSHLFINQTVSAVNVESEKRLKKILTNNNEGEKVLFHFPSEMPPENLNEEYVFCEMREEEKFGFLVIAGQIDLAEIYCLTHEQLASLACFNPSNPVFKSITLKHLKIEDDGIYTFLAGLLGSKVKYTPYCSKTPGMTRYEPVESVEELEGCPEIKELFITVEEWLKISKKQAKLIETLYIDMSDQSEDACFDFSDLGLEKCENLKHLKIRNETGDLDKCVGIEDMTDLPDLESLEISGITFVDGILNLPKSLKDLRLAVCEGIDKDILDTAPNLECLKLVRLDRFPNFKNLPESLVRLELWKDAIESIGMLSLKRGLHKCKNLKFFTMTKNIAEFLVKKFPNVYRDIAKQATVSIHDGSSEIDFMYYAGENPSCRMVCDIYDETEEHRFLESVYPHMTDIKTVEILVSRLEINIDISGLFNNVETLAVHLVNTDSVQICELVDIIETPKLRRITVDSDPEYNVLYRALMTELEDL